MNHMHHILPKHAGGTDDAENLIKLSISEHAEAHKILYETYGKHEDYLAWQGLAKLMEKQDIVRQLLSLAGKKGSATTNLKRWGCVKSDKPKRILGMQKGVGKGTSNRKWYHNPITFEKLSILPNENPPQDWVRGQGPRKSQKCYWFTNGKETGQFSLTDYPLGWVRGRHSRTK